MEIQHVRELPLSGLHVSKCAMQTFDHEVRVAVRVLRGHVAVRLLTMNHSDGEVVVDALVGTVLPMGLGGELWQTLRQLCSPVLGNREVMSRIFACTPGLNR